MPGLRMGTRLKIDATGGNQIEKAGHRNRLRHDQSVIGPTTCLTREDRLLATGLHEASRHQLITAVKWIGLFARVAFRKGRHEPRISIRITVYAGNQFQAVLTGDCLQHSVEWIVWSV